MSWSSGKDSAMALDAARSEGTVEVTALLCTVNAEADRVAMHAVRRSLLEAQADRLGLPLVIVEIPSPCPNEVYEAHMAAAIAAAVTEGVARVVFGDLFLREVRAYREDHLAGTGIAPMFPLWDRPTDVLAREMLEAGLKAIITCAPSRRSWQASSLVAASTPNYSTRSPRGLIPAARTVNSTPSSGTVPNFARPSTSISVRSSSETASSSATWKRPPSRGRDRTRRVQPTTRQL